MKTIPVQFTDAETGEVRVMQATEVRAESPRELGQKAIAAVLAGRRKVWKSAGPVEPFFRVPGDGQMTDQSSETGPQSDEKP